MLTLNQVLKRIETVVRAHRMVRDYQQQGLEPDFDNEHTVKYPSVNLMVQPGLISTAGKIARYGFKMTIEDLVNVAADTKSNEWDVVSDMNSIAQDFIAQFNNPNYDDWRFETDVNINYLFENSNDMAAGVVLDFSISVPYSQNACAVPSGLEIITEDNDDMKPVYDVAYIGNGTEGNTLDTETVGSSLSVVKGKKVLAVIREGAPLHKVSNEPDPAEYTWNDLVFTLGVPVNQPINGKGERFLILYRNY
ncbi:MAG: hypothetical protein QM791_04070 [Ferruginibacter sp.]